MPASRAQRAQTAERRAKAIALKLAGLEYETIAQRLGYASRGACCTDIKRALAANLEQVQQSAEELRTLELMRLDRLQAAAWPAAAQGDPRVIDTVLKIMAERRKYVPGLEAPARSEVTLDYIDDLIRAAEEDLGRGAAAGQAALSAGTETGEGTA